MEEKQLATTTEQFGSHEDSSFVCQWRVDAVDDISSEVLRALQERAVQQIEVEFEMRYLRQNKEDAETLSRNGFVLIPKKSGLTQLDKETRRICVRSVLATWYFWCLTILLDLELRKMQKTDKSWQGVHTYALKKAEVQRKHTLVALTINATLSTALARELIGGKSEVRFQEARVTGIPFDRTIKQGGKQRPFIFDVVMKKIFVALQKKWHDEGRGVILRRSHDPIEMRKVSHFIIADNCYLVAAGKKDFR